MKQNLYLRLPLTPTSDLLSSFEPHIPEHYLNGIIWRCDLFDPERGGVFMPKEFDFPCKKEEKATPGKQDFHAKSDEKTAKNAPKKPVSLQKNDENQQKMSENESKNQPKISSNELNFKHLRKNSIETNKNTIYNINITTSASTEEKEEAAAAEDVFSSPKRASAPDEPRPMPISKPTEESACRTQPACIAGGRQTHQPGLPHPRRRCHTSTSGMPHLNAPNATPKRSKCHTWSVLRCGIGGLRCGISPREMWHSEAVMGVEFIVPMLSA